MIKKALKLAKTTLFRGSLIVLVGTTVGNFLNYLYHLVSGRLLTPGEYGLLQSLISLTYFQSILVGAYSTAAIEKMGSTKLKDLPGAVRALERNGIKLSIIYWLLTLLSYPLIKKFLHLDNFQLFLIFSFQGLLAFIPIAYGSALRGQLKFLEGTIISVVSTFLKLLSAIVLLYLGLGVAGGLSSWLIWKVTSLVLGYSLVHKLWSFDKSVSIIKLDISFLKFSFLSLIVNLSLTSLYTTDIIFVRHYFNSYLTGIYSATSNLGKMIFFGSTTILTVAFPLFIKYRVKKKKLKWVLKLSLIFTLICSIGGVIGFHLFPSLFIKLLYGSKYLQANQYLGRFSLFIGLFAIFNLLIRFLLSLKTKFSAYLSMFVALGQVILILFNHQNIKAIINNSLVVVSLGLIAGLLIVLKLINERSAQQIIGDRSGI